MNLFAVDPLPGMSAIALDDRRLVKMVLETAQLLSTAVHQGAVFADGEVYRPTHVNHPVSKWVREDARNLGWTFLYFHALLNEYEMRFKRRHACNVIAQRLLLPEAFSSDPATFCNCTPYPELPVHGAYRLTLNVKWNNDTKAPTWRVRGEPAWRAVPHSQQEI